MIAIDGRYIQDHFPGIGRYTFNLIDALARVAPDDSFAVLFNPALRNTRYDIGALARYPNVRLQNAEVATVSLSEQYRLPSAIRDTRSALFHSPYFIKPYLLRKPSVVSIFDLIPLVFPGEMPKPLQRLAFRVAVSLAARSSTRIIVPSIATRDDLAALLRVPREKMTVIPLGVDACFCPQSDSEIMRVREKYSLPQKYVLTLGINKPHKNLATLIEAWRRAEVDAVLVIAGAWDARFGEEEQSKTLAPPARAGVANQKSKIHLVHDVDDVDLPALYSGASVFVMPSLYEGFGLPALEAMACGAPTIASNATSIPEVVGDAGFLFDPRDANALAALITRVLSDHALQDDLRAKSRARAARFSWERTARETMGVYKTASGS